jgi:hypothetical protein
MPLNEWDQAYVEVKAAAESAQAKHKISNKDMREIFKMVAENYEGDD